MKLPNMEKEGMKMRAFLEYRMKQEGVSRTDLQTLLNVSEKTIRNKLSGETDFTWSEAKAIRNKYFPKDDFVELFEQTTSESA